MTELKGFSLFDRDAGLSSKQPNYDHLEHEKQSVSLITSPKLGDNGSMQAGSLIGLEFRQTEPARVSALYAILALLAVALSALAVLTAVLVAFDSRTQLHELRAIIQSEKVGAERVKYVEEPRESPTSMLDIDEDDNWASKRFKPNWWLTNPDRKSDAGKGARRRRDSMTYDAPIPHCNCNDSEPSRLRNGCCCMKNEIDERRKEKFTDIVNRMPAGHFTSCIPSDSEAVRLNGSKIRVHLFRSELKDIFFGNSEPWSNYPKSRQTFEFDSIKQKLKIKLDGLYLIYVQVAKIMFTVGMVEVNGQEWLRCQHRPATHEYQVQQDGSLVMGRESCSMVGVRPLLADDEVRIRNGEIGFPIVTQAQCTYFGIVKLA